MDAVTEKMNLWRINCAKAKADRAKNNGDGAKRPRSQTNRQGASGTGQAERDETEAAKETQLNLRF